MWDDVRVAQGVTGSPAQGTEGRGSRMGCESPGWCPWAQLWLQLRHSPAEWPRTADITTLVWKHKEVERDGRRVPSILNILGVQVKDKTLRNSCIISTLLLKGI